jgi:hypothetical protein
LLQRRSEENGGTEPKQRQTHAGGGGCYRSARGRKHCAS